ncbi:hypothetical protein J8F10_00685 [Gemmata sp. G18]|uniref:Uncharacterized protein n=1 Tax=Gemmata palustris TaxID=2822762 RepID=A0ABS5BJD2_9BACT|nr:hypothetical protein [Gemmata palustris]MBP3953815.1 hypothetical protein [Gemmata palustris]
MLTTGAIVAAGIGFVSTGWFASQPPVLTVVTATGLCLSSAVATFLLADAVFRHTPQFGPIAVLMGTGVRMAVAVVGVLLLGEVLTKHGAPRDEFAGWVTYLYIVTLAIECGLLMYGKAQIIPEKAP